MQNCVRDIYCCGGTNSESASGYAQLADKLGEIGVDGEDRERPFLAVARGRSGWDRAR